MGMSTEQNRESTKRPTSTRVWEKKVVPRKELESPLSHREADFKLYIDNPKNT
jgi:hypothetical protein